MGRKKRKRVRTRPKRTLPKVFQCPFCSKTNRLKINIEKNKDTRKPEYAKISCSCSAFPKDAEIVLTGLKSIAKRVDVYGEFLDLVYKLQSSDKGPFMEWNESNNWYGALKELVPQEDFNLELRRTEKKKKRKRTKEPETTAKEKKAEKVAMKLDEDEDDEAEAAERFSKYL